MLKRVVSLAFLALTVAAAAAPAVPTPRPKLVVVISVDQFRADYLARFRDYYLPAKKGSTVGGFNYLADTGANYVDAHIAHVPTATGPGHASILTGSTPVLNGIIGNDWFNRDTGKSVYCVDDPMVETVGGTANPMSPKNLKVTTVGDELKMATGGKSKVVGISFKDRAAILLAGHAADTVIWFDSGNGAWVTSTFYAPSKRLPAWVEALNSKQIPDSFARDAWTPLLKDSTYDETRIIPLTPGPKPTPVFTHKLEAAIKPAFYKNFATSAFGQSYLFDTVKEAIEAEQLGCHTVPDLLAINLATNDYVGHIYGPNSPEVMDISIRTDRLLSDLFNYLDKSVTGGLDNVLIVLTADHGVQPIVEEEREIYRIPASRVSEKAVTTAINDTLVARYGAGQWVIGFTDLNLFLNRKLIAKKGLTLDSVQAEAAAVAAGLPGIQSVWTGAQIQQGRLPQWDWAQAVSRSYNPSLSGDLLIFTQPGSIPDEGTGTGHGTPWAYDSHIPILFHGLGIKPGIYGRRVETIDIAPTLTNFLGIEQPSGCIGRILTETISR